MSNFVSPSKSTDSVETIDISESGESFDSPLTPISKRRRTLNLCTWSPGTSDLIEVDSSQEDEDLDDFHNNSDEVVTIDSQCTDLSDCDLGCSPLNLANETNGKSVVVDQEARDFRDELRPSTATSTTSPASPNEAQDVISSTSIQHLDQQLNISSKRFVDFSQLDHREVHVFKCCKEECLSSVDVVDIIIARSRLTQMSTINQKQWLLDYISTHSKQSRTNFLQIIFIVQGYVVCRLAWFAIYGIGQKRFTKILDDHSKGVMKYEKHNQKMSPKAYHKSYVSKAWMEIYFDRIGDKMPDSLAIHLPSYLDRKTLYKYMCADLKVQGEDSTISYSQFCALMKTEFPDVLIPKVNRLTKCDVCTVLKEEKEKTLDGVLRSYYDRLLEFHNDLQKEEREKYYKHRGKARDVRGKEKYMCVIIDGMDQSKLLIPSLMRTAKSYSSAWKLKTHLTGILNHGRENLVLIDIQQWPHDANFTMNVLLRTISTMNSIPDYLYLQMDNCWRENKNQFVLTFLAALVKLNVFKKVKVNFLMVGHTHEDVDQLFSRIRDKLLKQNTRDLEDLINGVRESFTPTPQVELLTELFNIREWTDSFRTELHNISNPHCFLIKKDQEGDIELKYKHWTRDSKWLPEGEGLKLIKKDTELPEATPNFLAPSSEKIDLERLKTDIPKFLESRVFEEKQKEWWNKFLDDGFGYYTAPREKTHEWPMKDVLAVKRNQNQNEELGRQEYGILGIPRPPNLPIEVEELVADQVQDIPQVYTGRYQAPRILRQRVERVEDPLAALKKDVLVALHLEGQKKIPVIARVNEIHEETVDVTYLKGSWRKSWSVWLLRNKQPWNDTLTKECIILVDFQLGESGKLSNQTYKFLKQRYLELNV